MQHTSQVTLTSIFSGIEAVYVKFKSLSGKKSP